MIALDLYAGAGGLSIGLQRAGFTIAGAIELDRDAAATYRGLHPGVPVIEDDARNIDFALWRGSVDVICGGPPCQPFSSGGKRMGHRDPRDGVPAMIEAIRVIRPKAVLIENVAGLAAGSRRPYFIRTIAILRGMGFTISSWILDAADYGVAQHRRRLFIVATQARAVSPPAAQTSCRRTAGSVLETVDAGSLNSSRVVYAKRPHVRRSPHTGLLFNGSGRPIDLLKPAPTILASAGGNKTHFLDVSGHAVRYHRHLARGGKPRVGHVPGARRLTVSQSAALQDFPASAEFCGTPISQYRQIGNAVPPALAASAAGQLVSALHGG